MVITTSSWSRRARAAVNLRVQRDAATAFTSLRGTSTPPRGVSQAPAAPDYVLLVDDDPSLRRMLELSLREAGYRVESAADGRQALKRALVSPPQLVITDFNMPEMDGLQLIRALRAEERLAEIPVILHSGSTAEQGVLDGLGGSPESSMS